MIPKYIHFVYVGGRPFSFIHFLAVYLARRVNEPDKIYFHHTEEPEGIWWQLARPLVSLNPVEDVNQIHHHPILYPAHKADVIRLTMLAQMGGIYMDLDLLSLRPLDPLLHHNFVMGMEPGSGLCNALIMAHRDSPFLKHWQDSYHSFDPHNWNYHSVQVPWQLACDHPELIHVADKYAFFYPSHNDPVHRYLWGGKPTTKEILLRVGKNLVRSAIGRHNPIQQAYYHTFHALMRPEWHYKKLSHSYCLHLWEGLWGEKYLQAITPKYLQHADSHFARLLREILSEEELQAMENWAAPYNHSGADEDFRARTS